MKPLAAALAAAAAVAVVGCGGEAQTSTTVSAPASGSGHISPSPQTTSASASISASTTSASSAGPVLARGFHLSSPAFLEGRPIPSQYTCRGADRSPPLTISGAPPQARELVLVMRDPDAPTGNFVHWALTGIPATTRTIPVGAAPAGAVAGRNSFGSVGYRGPCPPPGPAHHYVLTVTALASPSGLRPGFSVDSLRTPAVAIATLIGTFGR